MSEESFSLETKKEIWNDRKGDYIEVGPDRDGLGLIEIRSFTSDGKCEARMAFNTAQANLLARALNELLDGK